METEKLIELVRQSRILYDLSHPKYSDTKAKNKVWCEIAERMKEPEAVCKKTWVNLREAYRRSVKRKKNSISGQASEKIRKWKYEEEMSFLSPHYNERQSLTTVDFNTEDDSCNEENIIGEAREMEGRLTPSTSENMRQCLPGDNVICQSNVSRNSPVLPKIKKAEEKQTAAFAMTNFTLKSRENNELDDIDLFCLSISSTIKKFSPYNIVLAKKEIFSIVSDIEFKELMENADSFSSEKI